MMSREGFLDLVGTLDDALLADCSALLCEGPVKKRPLPVRRLALLAAEVALAAVLMGMAVVHLSRVWFPASFDNLTEYNAQIYAVEPFQVSIKLPEGCALSTDFLDPASGQSGWSPVELQRDGQVVGVMDYNIFELYPEGPAIHQPGFYRMVYNQIMLNEQGCWDNDYTVVSQTDVSENARVQISTIEDYGNGRADNPVHYQPGILAYNTDLLVYVNIALEPGVFTDQELTDIAASIQLSR